MAKNPALDRTAGENVGRPSTWIKTPMHCLHARGVMPVVGKKISFPDMLSDELSGLMEEEIAIVEGK